MMDFSTTTTEKLRRTQVTIAAVLKVFPVLLLLAAVTLFVLKARFVLYIPVFTSSITFIPMVIVLNAINAELASRSKTNL